jgi:glycosyltransferase involved in cell wall biosynthesis
MVGSKRLCLLSPHFPPDLSGIGDYTYFLANALGGIGCEVDVLTAVGEIDTVLYPPARGVRIHRLVKTWGVRGLPHVLRVLRSLDPEVLVVQYAPHAFHPRGITLAISLLPALVRMATRIPVIVNFHELYIPFDSSLKHCVGALWQRAMGFLIAAPSHALTAVSTEWQRRLRRVGVWKPIQVIPVGSNIPRVDVSAEDVQRVREKLGMDRTALLIGSFGSVGPHGEVGLVLKAVEKLKPEGSLKLLWIGRSGPHTGRGAKWQETNQSVRDGSAEMIWTGSLPHPDVSRLMAACDLFVLPFTDGISSKRTTLAAALLHGLPILTTRGKQLDDIFVHRDNMYLVPVGDPQSFEDGLMELAQCPELRARLARGARALHDARFAWDVIAKQVARSAGERVERVTLMSNV